MGKGIGFGKKVSERFDACNDASVYSLQASSERGDVREMVKEIDPECLEIAGEVLDEAEKMFGKIDRSILFPMADHIEFAIKRMRSGEQIRYLAGLTAMYCSHWQIILHLQYRELRITSRSVIR